MLAKIIIHNNNPHSKYNWLQNSLPWDQKHCHTKLIGIEYLNIPLNIKRKIRVQS